MGSLQELRRERMTTKPETQGQTTAVATEKDSPSARFTNGMMREFGNIAGSPVELTPEQRRLAQHLFLKIDTSLKELEVKRLAKPEDKRNSTPILWQNLNMQKLAIDAMRRVELGLDALIANHIHPIPYWNSKEGKYDLDLRIGYVGKDFYKRRFALDPPKDVRYQLVYATDTFTPIMKSAGNPVESYEFGVVNPWERGEVVGGFAYLIYEDETKNHLILIASKQFEQSEAKGNKEFWLGPNREDMLYKTIVNRAMGKLNPDPSKTPESYQIIEGEYDEVQEDKPPIAEPERKTEKPAAEALPEG
jgi:recombination protein RecT